MTLTAGWFDDDSTDFAARLTGLPLMSADGTRYLHLGLGVRYRGDTDGLLRLKGRPESNITSYYVDTGEFPGKSLRALSLELLWTDGPLSVMAEIVPARTDAPEAGDPRFFGSSLVVSYVLTGENRPYDRHVGYAAGSSQGHEPARSKCSGATRQRISRIARSVVVRWRNGRSG